MAKASAFFGSAVKSSSMRRLAWLLLLPGLNALDNGLGRVPPMGWNAWNAFGHFVNETNIVQAADQIKALGLDTLGYVYVNVDDCWSEMERDAATDKLVANKETFPHGIAWLAKYMHDQGLKLGIYSSAGLRTCAGFPASLGREALDAQTFADWGVDYLKYDNCKNQGLPSLPRFAAMRNALNATGRPIYYSICQWGHETPWQWAPSVGNAWRTDGDMAPNWRSIKRSFHKTAQHLEAAQPGAYPDPDMLHVGNGKLVYEEYKAHFSLWCLIKAPLLLGNDLTQLTPELIEIITNVNLIQLHQDVDTPIVQWKHGIKNDDGDDEYAIYATTRQGLFQGQVVAIMINWGEFPKEAHVLNLAQILGLVPYPNQVVRITDLWHNQKVQPLVDEEGEAATAPEYFTLDTLQKVPVAHLERHSCVVYSFDILDREVADAAAAAVTINEEDEAGGIEDHDTGDSAEQIPNDEGSLVDEEATTSLEDQANGSGGDDTPNNQRLGRFQRERRPLYYLEGGGPQ